MTDPSTPAGRELLEWDDDDPPSDEWLREQVARIEAEARAEGRREAVLTMKEWVTAIRSGYPMQDGKPLGMGGSAFEQCRNRVLELLDDPYLAAGLNASEPGATCSFGPCPKCEYAYCEKHDHHAVADPFGQPLRHRVAGLNASEPEPVSPLPVLPVRIAGDNGPETDHWTCSCGLTRPVTGSYGCADCGDGRPDSWERVDATSEPRSTDDE